MSLKQAVTAFITNKNGMVVGVPRRQDPFDFGLPGGKLDPGETLEEAVIREIKEETGLRFFNVRPIYTRVNYGEVDFQTTTFVGDYEGELWTEAEASMRNEPCPRWIKPRALLFGTFGDYNMELYEFLLTNKLVR